MQDALDRPPSIPAAAADAWPVVTADGLRLSVYRLAGSRENGPVLLWGHANGFAAGSYLPLLSSLVGRAEVFAYDARGHGASEIPPEPLVRTAHVDRFAGDLERVVDFVRGRTGGRPLYFAAHSFSGVAALRLAGVFGIAPWRAMTLFEPPLTPLPEMPEHATSVEKSAGLIALAQRRRRRWASPPAYADSLAGRRAFAGWRADMLAAHAWATLRPTDQGDFELCCPPEIEAAIYAAVLNFTTFRALPRVAVPVRLVAGDPAPADGPPSWASIVQGLAAARLVHGELTVLTGAGHMMPFERPDACRDILLKMLKNQA